MRLDLPTLERPARQISVRSAAGSTSRLGTPLTNCQGRRNSVSPSANCAGVKRSALMRHAMPPRLAWRRTGSCSFLAAQNEPRLVNLGRNGMIGAIQGLLLAGLSLGERELDFRRAGVGV